MLRHEDHADGESVHSFMSVYWLPVLLAILMIAFIVVCQVQMNRRRTAEHEDPFLLEHNEQDSGKRTYRRASSQALPVRHDEPWVDAGTPRSRGSRSSIKRFRKILSGSAISSPRSELLQADRRNSSGPQRPPARSRSGGGPHEEFCFAVPIDALASIGQRGVLEVKNLGEERNPLRATLNKVHGSQSLAIFEGRKARAPVTTVGLALQDARATLHHSAFEVRGADGSHYGLLELQRDGSYNLMANGHALLTIDGSEESTLSLRLFSGNRVQIGQVSCRATGGTGAEEVVEIRSLPVIDPMLVVTCVLAVLLMCGEDDRGHQHEQP